jgi:SAM-dependent methyltransferase
MNVQNKVRAISVRVRQQAAERFALALPNGSNERQLSELDALRAAYSRLYQARNAVGQMPPSPNTFRARVGQFLVKCVQRMLFWYTPQILRFQNETAAIAGCAGNLFELQLAQTADLNRQVKKMRGQIASLEGELASRGGDARHTPAEGAHTSIGGPLLDRFHFELQDRFRGSEAETSRKLGFYLRRIQEIIPQAPPGDWLDLGCGRGEWLALASGAGYPILGIDSNAIAVSYCQARELNAMKHDSLSYLRSLPNESLAVVTAFHFVEHCPLDYLVALVQETARTLRPGGILILETPNPANLMVGSNTFWLDPTHQRPLPAALLELIIEHFGLTGVERFPMNPATEQERLPFGEIPFVQQLNDRLYGPQDYGLLGRR